MRIRNSGNHPQPQRSHLPPPDLLSSSILQQQQPPSPSLPSKPTFSPTKAMVMTSTDPLSSSPSDQQVAPHVMVSRINARLSSSIHNNGADFEDTFFNQSRSFAPDHETTTDDSWSTSTNEQSFGHGIFGQTSTSSSVSSSLASNGRWCEEERAIPLKKRRVVMVSYETNQSKEMKKKKKKRDALEETRKREMGESEGNDIDERCNRGNGKGWRCNKMRVKGHSLCKHHLERQRMRNIMRNQREGEDSFAVSGRPNQLIKENKRRARVVKARSMTNLLRDTVPLLYY
ncbi:hypothetical protein REPUB_Repub06bG0134900 [Reevesia pubescens]